MKTSYSFNSYEVYACVSGKMSICEVESQSEAKIAVNNRKKVVFFNYAAVYAPSREFMNTMICNNHNEIVEGFRIMSCNNQNDIHGMNTVNMCAFSYTFSFNDHDLAINVSEFDILVSPDAMFIRSGLDNAYIQRLYRYSLLGTKSSEFMDFDSCFLTDKKSLETGQKLVEVASILVNSSLKYKENPNRKSNKKEVNGMLIPDNSGIGKDADSKRADIKMYNTYIKYTTELEKTKGEKLKIRSKNGVLHSKKASSDPRKDVKIIQTAECKKIQKELDKANRLGQNLGDGVELVHTAALEILERLDEISSEIDPGRPLLKTKYTFKTENRRKAIKEDVCNPNSGVTQLENVYISTLAYRAIDNVYSYKKRLNGSLKSKSIAKEDYTNCKGPDDAPAFVRVEKEPKSHVVQLSDYVALKNALCAKYSDKALLMDGFNIKMLLRMTKPQRDVYDYRTQGYGVTAIATKTGYLETTVSRAIDGIGKKFQKFSLVSWCDYLYNKREKEYKKLRKDVKALRNKAALYGPIPSERYWEEMVDMVDDLCIKVADIEGIK